MSIADNSMNLRIQPGSSACAIRPGWSSQSNLARFCFARTSGADYEELPKPDGNGYGAVGYDLLIRLRDQTWMGFAFDEDEVCLIKNSTDDHTALPKPWGETFRKEGGIILKTFVYSI